MMEANYVSNRLESFNRGAYQFSFYQMFVGVMEGLNDPETLSPIPQSTFFHEYIHYLQDITTTFGLVNCGIVVNQMKFMNHYILDWPTAQFMLPVPLEDDRIMRKNNQLRALYMGYPSPTLRSLNISHIDIVNSDIHLGKPYYKHAKVINVYYHIGDGRISTLSLGGLHLAETICHIAQQTYVSEIIHDDVPYRVGELVAKHIHNPIGNNPLYVVALCELCLMAMHPGEAFFKMLMFMKEEDFYPRDEFDIVSFVFKKINYEQDQNLVDVFNNYLLFATEQLTGYFTTEVYKEEIQWIKTVMANAGTLRLSQPLLITSLLKEKILFSDKLKKIITQLGSPLMMNLLGECHWYLPNELRGRDIRLDRFAAIQQIYDLMFYKKRGCELKDFCKKGIDGDFTDPKCNHAPWERGQYPQLCGYGMFWKTWKMNGKFPDENSF